MPPTQFLLERLLMLVVGAVFVAGGGFIAKNSLDAKNLIESALFGLMGMTIGLFLVITAFTAPQ